MLSEPLLEIRRGSGRLRTRLPGAQRGRGGEAQQGLPRSNKVIKEGLIVSSGNAIALSELPATFRGSLAASWATCRAWRST